MKKPRKIEVNGSRYEVYGQPVFALIPVTTNVHGGGWIISDAPPEMLGNNPMRCNSLYRITDKGARMPVLFKDEEMARELLYILNRKL